MKLKTKLLGSLALLSAVGLSSNAMAQACPQVLTLPAVAPNGQSVTFGDAVSYSLPILGIDVQSSPGQIQDCVVVATGASGQGVTTNLAGMNDAYATPNGTGGSPYFRTGDPTSAPDPGTSGPAFLGDSATSWDTRVSALKTFLAGNDMVVYFNHNQTKSGSTIDEDLYIWAQVRLVDDKCVGANGLPISAAACAAAGGAPTLYFYVTSIPNATGLTNFGQPGADPTAYTGPQSLPTSTYPGGPDGTCSATPVSSTGTFPSGDQGTGTGSGDACFMVRSLGHICLSGPVGVIGSVPVPCSGPHVAEVDENLGANNVANAVIFPEINAILDAATNPYGVVQFDIRMGCSLGVACPAGSPLNNGYEQLFLGRLSPTVGPPGLAPEPATLALFGLGLLVAGLGRVRRRKI
jgi:hypothetical protein